MTIDLVVNNLPSLHGKCYFYHLGVLILYPEASKTQLTAHLSGITSISPESPLPPNLPIQEWSGAAAPGH